MKKRIKLKDNNEEKIIEVNIRATDHLAAQLNLRKHVFTDKTKYSRKRKYKNFEEN